MAKEWAKRFYNSKAWRTCRDSYISFRIAVDGGICEECKEEQGYIVHHKNLLTEKNINDPLIALNYENLMYVCKHCHDEYEDHGVGNKKTKCICFFDKDGQPVSLRSIDRLPPD